MANPRQGICQFAMLYSVISNFIGKFVMLGVGFLLTPFMLYQLGATVYGLWALVGSVVGYGSLFDFGIAHAVTKYTAEYSATRQLERARGVVAISLWLYSIIGLVVIILSAIVAKAFPVLFSVPPEQHSTAVWLMMISGMGIGLSIPCSAAPAVLRGLQRFDLTNLINIIGTLLSAGLTVGILLSGGSIIDVASAGLIVLPITQALSVWWIYRIAPELRFGFRGGRREQIRTVASYSSSTFLLHLGGHLESQTDEIVVGAFLPIKAVTPYSIARRLSTLPQVVAEQFVNILLPYASEMHAGNDRSRLRQLYIASTRITLVILLPIGGLIIMLAQSILIAWVGDAYADYADLVLILTIACLIDTSVWPAGMLLQGMARHRRTAILAICSGLTNLVLSIVLVRFMGLLGVALGTLIPTTIICVGFVMPYAMREIGVSLREVLAEVFLPTLVPMLPMIITVYALQNFFQPFSIASTAIVAVIGLLIYLMGYGAIGARETERDLYRRLTVHLFRLIGAHPK